MKQVVHKNIRTGHSPPPDHEMMEILIVRRGAAAKRRVSEKSENPSQALFVQTLQTPQHKLQRNPIRDRVPLFEYLDCLMINYQGLAPSKEMSPAEQNNVLHQFFKNIKYPLKPHFTFANRLNFAVRFVKINESNLSFCFLIIMIGVSQSGDDSCSSRVRLDLK